MNELGAGFLESVYKNAYPNYYTYHVHHAACDHVYPVQFLNHSPFGCLKGTIHSQADLVSPIDEMFHLSGVVGSVATSSDFYRIIDILDFLKERF